MSRVITKSSQKPQLWRKKLYHTHRKKARAIFKNYTFYIQSQNCSQTLQFLKRFSGASIETLQFLKRFKICCARCGGNMKRKM
ncbi:hypothetical protein EVA_14383 [gut metagenome]|uniref:Uncharacterized protein n=1 Tax=gut metagenome TaxID=749906 RepID=J9CC37_9ZZZZ